jgi:hypothetical protein
VIVLPHRDHLEAQIFGDALQGREGPFAGAAHLRSSPAHKCLNSSSVILVTVPAPTGAGTIAAER